MHSGSKCSERQASSNEVHYLTVWRQPFVSETCGKALQKMLRFTVQNAIRGDDKRCEVCATIHARLVVLGFLGPCDALQNCDNWTGDIRLGVSSRTNSYARVVVHFSVFDLRLTAYLFVRVEVRWYHGTRAF